MARFSTSLLGQAETVLLATDGSHFSDGALQEAIFFGQACRAKVIVLHVVQVEAESIRAANSMVMQRQQEMAPYLDQIRKMARDGGLEIEIVVVGGDNPEKTIVEQARLRNADAILMGRHGKTGRLSLLVGSMTAKVIGQGFPRVLVVPKDFLITGEHLILALDGSPNSRQAVQEALSLGKTCSTLRRLTVMAVVKRGDEEPRAREMVEEVCAQCSNADLRLACEPLVQIGNPAPLIVAAAKARKVDMILMGGGGKSFMGKILLGSVTKNVIGEAPCAVLVVTA